MDTPRPSRTSALMTTLAFLLFIVMVPSSTIAQPAPANPDEAQPAQGEKVDWEGSVKLPGGMNLDILVKFKRSSADEPWTAKIDIPMQNAFDFPLINVVNTNTELGFSLAPHVGADFHAVIDPDDPMKATGELKQSGQVFPLELHKVPAGVKPTVHRITHPQTPKPPFPYEAREVSFANTNGGITIAGTLTLPEGDGPFPAVVMITGSGAQDRDETLLGHKPFAVIADYFTRRGIAVLRTDDRGVGGTTGSVTLSTSSDFASDALAGVSFLQTQDKIDPDRIGLIGHSEGGLIAPIAASQSKAVDFIILLAGTGVSGREILVRQLADIFRTRGVDEEALKNKPKRKFVSSISSWRMIPIKPR